MPSGTRGRGNPDYSSTEYAQPWGGIDVSKPSSQISPGSCVAATGSIIRGGITNGASINTPIVGVSGNTTFPGVPVSEVVCLIANLNGVTIVVTSISVYSDLSPTSPKTFTKCFTFTTGYNDNGTHVGSILIANSLYFSSSNVRGVYKVTITSPSAVSITEISAKNGSQPFIGGDFLFTISNRLCLANIIGGDGNQTGSVTSASVTNGGTGYPASGSVLFTGGGGQSATGTFTASGGVITGITVTNGGSGFLSAPTPSIVGTTGTGFTGTATISGFTSNSTNTNYPDYVAWSFPGSYGSFDPNSILLGGGFNQITDARGFISGASVFEAVGFLAHNGGFTEMVPNTSSSIGSNVEPFTFAPLWSADQGVVCRYGSMAQYGAMCCFLGYDQPYQLTPNGLSPFGGKIASLVQNLSYWNDPTYTSGGVVGNGGLYGSIVEIEGEKHYLIVFTSNITVSTQRFSYVYDCNIGIDAWTTWFYNGLTITAPIYQSYDIQVMNVPGSPPFGNILRDNWLLVPTQTGTDSGAVNGIQQMLVGNMLFLSSNIPSFASSFSLLLRSETPSIAIPQTTRRLLIEYENIPNLSSTPTTLNCTLYGQPLLPGNGSSDQTPIANTFTISLPYYASGANVPQNSVLTALSAPIGTAHTALATSLSLSTNSPIRLIRAALIAETTQGDLQ